MNWFKKLFRIKSLRDKCVEAYGEEFGVMYDMVNRGEAIGNFAETCVFLKMVEAVRKGEPVKLKEKTE